MSEIARSAATRSVMAWILALAACTPRGGAPHVAGDASEDVPGVVTRLSVLPARFAVGDPVTVAIEIENLATSDSRIRFPRDRQIGLLVFSSAGELEFLDERSIAIPSYLDLGTFETWRHETVWDGRIERRQGPEIDLPPGRYELQIALRRSDDVQVNRSNRVRVEVVSAP